MFNPISLYIVIAVCMSLFSTIPSHIPFLVTGANGSGGQRGIERDVTQKRFATGHKSVAQEEILFVHRFPAGHSELWAAIAGPRIMAGRPKDRVWDRMFSPASTSTAFVGECALGLLDFHLNTFSFFHFFSNVCLKFK